MPALVAGLTVTIVFLAVLSIVLTAAGPDGLALPARARERLDRAPVRPPDDPEPLPHAPISDAVAAHRERLRLIIFFGSLGDRVAFEEPAGATMLAGGIVLVTAILGLTGQLARYPRSHRAGLIAGAVMPFLVGAFSSLSTSDGEWRVAVMVGAAVAGYLLGQRVLGTQFPAIVPAFLADVSRRC